MLQRPICTPCIILERINHNFKRNLRKYLISICISFKSRNKFFKAKIKVVKIVELIKMKEPMSFRKPILLAKPTKLGIPTKLNLNKNEIVRQYSSLVQEKEMLFSNTRNARFLRLSVKRSLMKWLI